MLVQHLNAGAVIRTAKGTGKVSDVVRLHPKWADTPMIGVWYDWHSKGRNHFDLFRIDTEIKDS